MSASLPRARTVGRAWIAWASTSASACPATRETTVRRKLTSARPVLALTALCAMISSTPSAVRVLAAGTVRDAVRICPLNIEVHKVAYLEHYKRYISCIAENKTDRHSLNVLRIHKMGISQC